MDTFEVTQKILTLGPVYEVRVRGEHGVLMTIKGKVLTASPKLAMVEGAAGRPVATLSGNLAKTRFACKGDGGRLIGTIAFPLLSMRRTFTITVGDVDYEADGGFLGGDFRCKSPGGDTVLVIAKQVSIKDRFAVSTTGALPREVALLAAVAIDQRFFGAG